MYKIGYKLVCVYKDDSNDILELNRIYTISAIEDWYVKLYETGNFIFDFDRFISLTEQRKQKIERICLSQVTELK